MKNRVGGVCPQQNWTQNCCIIQQSHFGYASEGTKSLNPRGICTPMSTGSFFTTVETSKQPQCPVIDEWVKRTWDTHTVESLFRHKREGHSSTADNREEHWGRAAKWNKSIREKADTSWLYCHVESKKSQTPRNCIDWWLSGAGGWNRRDTCTEFQL